MPARTWSSSKARSATRTAFAKVTRTILRDLKLSDEFDADESSDDTGEGENAEGQEQEGEEQDQDSQSESGEADMQEAEGEEGQTPEPKCGRSRPTRCRTPRRPQDGAKPQRPRAALQPPGRLGLQGPTRCNSTRKSTPTNCAIPKS
ncbi:MAG: hypothetical protein WDN03_14620 [Rhizomicrobium sp.]